MIYQLYYDPTHAFIISLAVGFCGYVIGFYVGYAKKCRLIKKEELRVAITNTVENVYLRGNSNE